MSLNIKETISNYIIIIIENTALVSALNYKLRNHGLAVLVSSAMITVVSLAWDYYKYFAMCSFVLICITLIYEPCANVTSKLTDLINPMVVRGYKFCQEVTCVRCQQRAVILLKTRRWRLHFYTPHNRCHGWLNTCHNNGGGEMYMQLNDNWNLNACINETK